MRTVFLISSFLGLTGVYIFACGALNLSQTQGAAERFRLLDRWPFLDVTPLAASVTEALRGRAIPLLRDHLSDAALCRWLEAHAPQLGWPPDTWRLL